VRILTRYVLGRFAQLFVLSYVAFVSVFVVVDLASRLSAFIDQGVPLRGVFAYYAWSLPYFSLLVLPMAVLLACLFCFGSLVRSGELDAMKSAGLSLYRIVLPVQLLALVISGLAFVVADRLMPEGNRKRAALERGERPRFTAPVRAQVVLRDVDGQVLSVGQYFRKERRGTQVALDRYDGRRLVQKIRAEELAWVGGGWVLRRGDVRHFGKDGRQAVRPFLSMPAEGLTLTPEDLSQEYREIDQMGFRELRSFIERRRRNGEQATREEVEWHLRLAFPFACFVMVLLGSPIASRSRRAGRPLLVGLCLLISFAYYGSIQGGRALGWNGMLPPAAGAWGANVLFLAAGWVLVWRAHK
jgi:lipopolysaccharide export system permease protein